jgi:FkbM family methyltransferase
MAADSDRSRKVVRNEKREGGTIPLQKIMDFLTKGLKDTLFGKKSFQPFFRRLFDISIEGMNIGTGGRHPKENGELFVIDYVLSKEKDPIFFDVGALGGSYIEEILELSRGGAEIYAFEPVSREYEILHAMFGDKITLVKSALGSIEGEMEIYYPEGVSGLASLYKPHEGFDKSERVNIETVDSFCTKHNIKSIALLKLDAEGNELDCLKGAQKMLPNIKYIQFEFSAASRDARIYFRDIFNFLSEYRIYRILKDGFCEIKEPEKITESLFTTNYFAKRKSI